MDEPSKDIEKTLVIELKVKGVGENIIPRLIKDLSYSFESNPSITLSDANERLRFMGWDDVELDYHTLQLAIAALERGQSGLET
jgi:hypothetical protein